jgi:hypothetical protein
LEEKLPGGMSKQSIRYKNVYFETKQIGKGGSSDEIHNQTAYLHMRKTCVAHIGHCFDAGWLLPGK